MAACFLAPEAAAAIAISHGNGPVSGAWPSGAGEVANLKERLGHWMEMPYGGGRCHLAYRVGKTGDFNRALKLFSRIQAPELVLEVHKKKGPTGPLEAGRVDWILTLCDHETWHRLHHAPRSRFLSSTGPDSIRSLPVPPPKIDVFLDEKCPIQWEEVEVPGNITVIDRRSPDVPKKTERSGAGNSTIRIGVFGLASAKPIAGASVSLVRILNDEVHRGASSEKGTLEFSGIPPGLYRLDLQAPGHASRKMNLDPLPRASCHTIQVKLAKTASLMGRVVNEKGEPQSGITVVPANLRSLDYSPYHCEDIQAVLTDLHGRFRLDGLPRGYAELKLKRPEAIVFIASTSLIQVPSSGFRVLLETPGTIQGTVAGEIRPNTQVHIKSTSNPIYGKAYTVNCARDGFFEIKDVPPGEYRIGTDGGKIFDIDQDDSGFKYVYVKPGEKTEVKIGE